MSTPSITSWPAGVTRTRKTDQGHLSFTLISPHDDRTGWGFRFLPTVESSGLVLRAQQPDSADHAPAHDGWGSRRQRVGWEAGLAQAACLRGCALLPVRARGRSICYSLTRPEVEELPSTTQTLVPATGTAVEPCTTYVPLVPETPVMKETVR